jgi:hypothetical protein
MNPEHISRRVPSFVCGLVRNSKKKQYENAFGIKRL